MKRFILPSVVLMGFVVILVLLGGQSDATACGGFFCTNTAIDQSTERIIFTVNDDGTITAIVGIGYVGTAEDFSWVVPVPSPPELDVADTRSLNNLHQATQVSFVSPPNYCRGLLNYNPNTESGGGGVGGGGGYLEEGNIGPYDYAIIGSEDPDELIEWLRANSYQVTESMEPVIAQYVEENMLFLAMRLSEGQESSNIQPIVMTYESEKPMIPIRLTAVAAVDNMPILVWIFADKQYVPENFAHSTPDYTSFSMSSPLLYDTKELWTDTILTATGRESKNYMRIRDQIQREHDGLAFITEYAQPSANLINFVNNNNQNLTDDPLIGSLIENYPYVTRLYGSMSPEQMILDPTFISDAEAADISNQINLADYVDPLDYWQCSSRHLAVGISENQILPEERYFSDMSLTLRQPSDWVLTELQIEEIPVWFIAPREVTHEDVDAYFDGNSIIPLFTFYDTEIAYEQLNVNLYETSTFTTFPTIFGYSQFPPTERIVYSYVGRRLKLRESNELYSSGHSLVFAILTSDADWGINRETYIAMLDYAQAFQYYQDPELQHTLFLALSKRGEEVLQTNPKLVAIPYPEDWQEYSSGTGQVVIQPVENLHDETAPILRLIRYEFNGMNESRLNELAVSYGLSSEVVENILAQQLSVNLEGEHCRINSNLVNGTPVHYEKDGRQGFILITEYYVAEVSAQVADFANYVDIFPQMLAGICPTE